MIAPGIVPKLSLTPGAITRRAPTLGEDTEVVLGRLQEGKHEPPG